MSETTPNLTLPYILPSQAQKHVTHNEALRALDALVQLTVIDRDRTAEPTTPTDGDRHIVAPSATGAWAGQEGMIAAFQDGAWMFYRPLAGWIAMVTAENRLVFHDGLVWIDYQPGIAPDDLQNLESVGINTTADTYNRLAMAAPATLLTHEGAGHQLKINKNTGTDTASLLFQTGWSGRAEMGTAGADDFTIKVSANGGTWHTALHIDTSGNVGIGKAPGTALDVEGIMRLKPTPKASLPAASAAGAGALTYVSDASGGAQPAYSNGSNWLKISDGLAV